MLYEGLEPPQFGEADGQNHNLPRRALSGRLSRSIRGNTRHPSCFACIDVRAGVFPSYTPDQGGSLKLVRAISNWSMIATPLLPTT